MNDISIIIVVFIFGLLLSILSLYYFKSETVNVVCPEGYTTMDFKKCEKCIKDTYSLEGNIGMCKECETGYYSQPGSSQCSSCPTGSYYDLDSKICKMCSNQIDCIQGKGCATGEGATSCEVCEDDTELAYSIIPTSECMKCYDGMGMVDDPTFFVNKKQILDLFSFETDWYINKYPTDNSLEDYVFGAINQEKVTYLDDNGIEYTIYDLRKYVDEDCTREIFGQIDVGNVISHYNLVWYITDGKQYWLQKDLDDTKYNSLGQEKILSCNCYKTVDNKNVDRFTDTYDSSYVYEGADRPLATINGIIHDNSDSNSDIYEKLPFYVFTDNSTSYSVFVLNDVNNVVIFTEVQDDEGTYIGATDTQSGCTQYGHLKSVTDATYDTVDSFTDWEDITIDHIKGYSTSIKYKNNIWVYEDDSDEEYDDFYEGQIMTYGNNQYEVKDIEASKIKIPYTNSKVAYEKMYNDGSFVDIDTNGYADNIYLIKNETNQNFDVIGTDELNTDIILTNGITFSVTENNTATTADDVESNYYNIYNTTDNDKFVYFTDNTHVLEVFNDNSAQKIPTYPIYDIGVDPVIIYEYDAKLMQTEGNALYADDISNVKCNVNDELCELPDFGTNVYIMESPVDINTCSVEYNVSFYGPEVIEDPSTEENILCKEIKDAYCEITESNCINGTCDLNTENDCRDASGEWISESTYITDSPSSDLKKSCYALNENIKISEPNEYMDVTKYCDDPTKWNGETTCKFLFKYNETFGEGEIEAEKTKKWEFDDTGNIYTNFKLLKVNDKVFESDFINDAPNASIIFINSEYSLWRFGTMHVFLICKLFFCDKDEKDDDDEPDTYSCKFYDFDQVLEYYTGIEYKLQKFKKYEHDLFHTDGKCNKDWFIIQITDEYGNYILENSIDDYAFQFKTDLDTENTKLKSDNNNKEFEVQPHVLITSSSLSKECTYCEKGHYSSGGSECQPCGIGTYAPIKNMSECFDCPYGYYAGSGATQCSLCVSGKYDMKLYDPEDEVNRYNFEGYSKCEFF